MTVKMRLTERPNWTKLGSITKKFGTADKIALKAIQGEISSHEDDMGPDLFGQLDARFQQYQSARQLQEFPNLVKLVGLTSKGFFLGILQSDLHAWQMQFSQKQLRKADEPEHHSGSGVVVHARVECDVGQHVVAH